MGVSRKLPYEITTPADYYIPPTDKEIKDMADQMGVRDEGLSVARDIINLASGGKFLSTEEVQELVESTARQHAIRGSSGLGLGLSPNEIAQKTRDIFSYELQSTETLTKFLKEFRLELAPGNTPMEKALSAVYLMQNSQEDDSNPESMNEGLKLFNDLSENDKELLGLEKDPNVAEVEQVLQFVNQFKEIIKISRTLDKLSTLHVFRLSEPVPDPEGNEVRYRPMADLNEMARMPAGEWALPESYRLHRHITGQTQIREHVVRVEKKQLIYLLVDGSGSMGCDRRAPKATAVLYNRVKAVFNGDAEVYFRFFEDRPLEEYHLDTKEKAKAAMQKILQAEFPGGGTSIDTAVKAAVKRIQEIMEERSTHRPEIVIVSDGEDRICSKPKDLEQIRVHSFTCDGSNPQLNQLALSTGGVGIYL